MRKMLSDYHIELTERYGLYIAFDGEEGMEDRVEAHLENNGMPTRYAGRSRRSANNGRRYDWFVRLQFEGDEQECESELERIFSLDEEQQEPERNQCEPPVSSWHVESNTYGHYLAFNFNSEDEDEKKGQFDEIVHALSQAGINHISNGVSRRAADNGTHYDWYIRTDIEREEDHTTALELMRSALAGTPHVVDTTALAGRVDQLTAKFKEIEQAAIRLKQVAERRKQENERLRSRVEELQAQTDDASDISQMQRVLDAVRSKLEQTEAMYVEADDTCIALREKNVGLQSQIAALTQNQNQGPVSRPRSNDNLIKELFSNLLGPRLKLDEDSYRVMQEEFSRINPLLTALTRYTQQQQQALRRLDGTTNPIWELSGPEGHIQTGRQGVSDRGRLYFRELDEDSHIAFVRVKKNGAEQRRTINRIDGADLSDALGM